MLSSLANSCFSSKAHLKWSILQEALFDPSGRVLVPYSPLLVPWPSLAQSWSHEGVSDFDFLRLRASWGSWHCPAWGRCTGEARYVWMNNLWIKVSSLSFFLANSCSSVKTPPPRRVPFPYLCRALGLLFRSFSQASLDSLDVLLSEKVVSVLCSGPKCEDEQHENAKLDPRQDLPIH